MNRIRRLGAVAFWIVLLSLVGCDNLMVNMQSTESVATDTVTIEETYAFRSQDLYDQHYNKHGQEFGEISQEEYLRLANQLFNTQEVLRKTEADGDALYYDPESNTFGVLSQDGYIRTCFKPDDGMDYWNRQ